MSAPKPNSQSILEPTKSKAELLSAINKLSQHENFAEVYASRTHSKLNRKQNSEEIDLHCLYSHLVIDQDLDGIRDWKIMSDGKMLSHLLPLDQDWDNDGIMNLFDSKPVISNPSDKLRGIPPHLGLKSNYSDPLNILQRRLFETCGVLFLNHTGNHVKRSLEIFDQLCSSAIKKIKKSPYTFVVYSFEGQAQFDNSIASFYPGENFVSIGSGSRLRRYSKDHLLKTFAHEMGHFFIFNLLSPKELHDVAARFAGVMGPGINIRSFYDPALLSKLKFYSSSFVPSVYSETNVHEWMSDVISEYFVELAQNTGKSRLPPQLKEWISKRFK